MAMKLAFRRLSGSSCGRQMDVAELYAVYNSMQRSATETVLQELCSRLAWGEGEHVLDVGCGPGDVTSEVLLPRLPASASVVGLDISPKMVEYARKNYSNSRVNFKEIDFATKNITDFFETKYFSKVFSFYCLHWIQDQEQAARNIFTLLRPGGEFLALVASSNKTFTIYKMLSKMDKWKSYMKDVDNFIPCFHGSAEPCKELRQVLISQGLDVLLCEERVSTFSFPSMQVLIQSSEAVNPFVRRMSQETRKQHMASFQQVVEDLQLCTVTASGEVLTENPLIVVYGRRPP